MSTGLLLKNRKSRDAYACDYELGNVFFFDPNWNVNLDENWIAVAKQRSRDHNADGSSKSIYQDSAKWKFGFRPWSCVICHTVTSRKLVTTIDSESSCIMTKTKTKKFPPCSTWSRFASPPNMSCRWVFLNDGKLLYQFCIMQDFPGPSNYSRLLVRSTAEDIWACLYSKWLLVEIICYDTTGS